MKHRKESRSPSFSSYAAAAGAMAAATSPTAEASFIGPYEVTPPAEGQYNGASAIGAFGAWTATLSSGIDVVALNTALAPDSILMQASENFGARTTPNTLDFLAMAIATGLVSFDYDLSFLSNPASGSASAAYFDGTSMVSLSEGSSSIQFPINSRQTFGFSVSSIYDGGATLTVSDFSAPIPEPHSLAVLAMGFMGLLARRELQKRRG